MWAIPGSFVHQEETLEDAAQCTLAGKTGLRQVYLEQLAAFGDPARDPQARVITIAYFALLDAQLVHAPEPAADVAWFSLAALPPLAFDHAHILDVALRRLQSKLDYTTIAFHFLPQHFTLGELQQVYEAILRKRLDKRNFRKKMLAAGVLERIEEQKREGVHHRPASLYRLHLPGEQRSAHA